jgi:C-terminal processing protease CtpA/Prc
MSTNYTHRTRFATNAPNDHAPIVYTKPLITLVHEFSMSAGDVFPAML